MKNCVGRMTSLRGIAAVLPATQPSAKARKQLETIGRRQCFNVVCFNFDCNCECVVDSRC